MSKESLVPLLGEALPGRMRSYVAPDPAGKLHNSMSGLWPALEILPKRTKWREWASRPSLLGFYLPLSEPRVIQEGAIVHYSVISRMDAIPTYRPVNLPPHGSFRIQPPAMPAE